MIVCKFGGSSLANAGQFWKIKNIVQSKPERSVVVVSALGKDAAFQHKITDLLYLCHAHLKYGVSFDAIFDEIADRYESVQSQLGLDLKLKDEFNKIKATLKSNTEVDELVSLGEKFSAIILAKYLDYTFVDAKDVIALKVDGSVDSAKCYAKLQAVVLETPRIVIPGFYGSLPSGRVKVLPRGGSDITGALCAAALEASTYENWTDVSGVLMADPRIVSYARSIDEMTFAELREMAFMGASVLHEESIQPVKLKGIPLNIRNTNEPDHPGTRIVTSIPQEKDPKRFITGITGLKDFTVISIVKEQVAKEPSFFRQVLECFETYHIPLELMAKGIDSFTLTVKTESVKEDVDQLLKTIEENCKPDRIVVEEDLALIACVGRKMKLKPGISGQLFSALGKANINIRSIAQGTDEISILVGVDTKDFNQSIQVLYDRFIEG